MVQTDKNTDVGHVKTIRGVTRGRTAPGDTLQGDDTRRKKILWANFRIVEKRGRTGKKGVG